MLGSICIYLWLIFNCATFQYTIAMMGYGPEDKNAVLELTYNYGVKEYDKGNGYAQVNLDFFPSCILLQLLKIKTEKQKDVTISKHQLCLKVSMYIHLFIVAFISCNLLSITLQWLILWIWSTNGIGFYHFYRNILSPMLLATTTEVLLDFVAPQSYCLHCKLSWCVLLSMVPFLLIIYCHVLFPAWKDMLHQYLEKLHGRTEFNYKIPHLFMCHPLIINWFLHHSWLILIPYVEFHFF